MEDTALHLQCPAKLCGIGQVSVVAQRHIALAVADDDGLGIGPSRTAAGRIAHMTDSDISLSQPVQCAFRKHLIDQPDILVMAENALAADRDPRGLLPPVLQGKQTRIDIACHRAALPLPYSKNSALLMDHRTLPPKITSHTLL